MFYRPSYCRYVLKELVQEARVAFGWVLITSYASVVLSIHARV